MYLNSVPFLVFVVLVVAAVAVTPRRARAGVLLVLSLAFYATFGQPHLLVVLLGVGAVSYAAGRLIGGARGGIRTALLWAGIVANLGVMLGVRYVPAVSGRIDAWFGLATGMSFPGAPALVALGVSYYALQATSYLIDVYLEVQPAETRVGRFALYLSFFPKLLQGPIERAGDLLPQFERGFTLQYENLRVGLVMIAWGMFKKTVIADRLAPYVNTVYDHPSDYAGLTLVLATLLFALQVYYDFSGYTDIALGVARFFDIRLTQNFWAPYLATSVADFWRRWHISFSRWILDYIFKPTQMSLRRLGRWGSAIALIVTFLFSGVWHGFTACFVAWGLLHGLGMAVSLFYKPLQKRLYKGLRLEKTFVQRAIQTAFTFAFICFTWIFFRAAHLGDAFYIVSHLFTGTRGLHEWLWSHGTEDLIVAGVALGALVLLHLFGRLSEPENGILTKPLVYRWAVYHVLLVATLLLLAKDTSSFVYTQF